MTSWAPNEVQSLGGSTDVSYVGMGDDSLRSHQSGSASSQQQVLVSERVQALASTIYQEFEAIIHRYDEDAVKKLMPVVVSALEQLDLSLTSQAELQAEVEILREDNCQLLGQYEREKAQRKSVAARCNEVEDAKEDEIKQLVGKVDNLESIVRLLDARLKSANDHSARSEERCEELKREHTKLHDRYTELFRSHVEYVDRTKQLFGIDRSDSQSTIDRVHLRRHLSSNMPRTDATTDSNVLATDSSSSMDFGENQRRQFESSDEAHVKEGESDRNSLDLSTELNRLSGVAPQNATSKGDSSSGARHQQAFVGGELDMEAEVSRVEPSAERQSATAHSNSVTADFVSVHAPTSSGPGEQQASRHVDYDESLNGLPSVNSMKALNKNALRNFYSLTSSDDILGANSAGDSQKNELESGADATSRVLRPFSIESEHSGNMSMAQDVPADISGMRKVTDHLIKENVELLEKKNALNVLKDDLLAQIEQGNSERMLQLAEIESLKSVKSRLQQRTTELEEETRRLRDQLAQEKRRADSRRDSDDDADNDRLQEDADGESERDVPYAQRKRFTRLEMARVLMERNMYKERLYELQESIRFAESVRAAREQPDTSPSSSRTSQQQLAKKRTTLWNLFGGLFSGAAGSQPQSQPQTRNRTSSSSSYTPLASAAPTTDASTPRFRPRASTGTTAVDSPKTKPKALLSLHTVTEVQSDSASRQIAQLEQRRAAYLRIRDYLQSNDNELPTAYGWSLPPKVQERLGVEAKSALVEIPVPVYVRPLDTKGSMKTWCAVAVNLNGFDQPAPAVGESLDSNENSSVEMARSASEVDNSKSTLSTTSGSQSEGGNDTDPSRSAALFRFEREIERALDDLRTSENERQGLTSIMWVSVTLDATSSQIIVVDANNRGEILARFTVSADRLTSVCSVPGYQPATDYVSRPANLRRATALQPTTWSTPGTEASKRSNNDDADSTSQRSADGDESQTEGDSHTATRSAAWRKRESASSPSRMMPTLVGSAAGTSSSKPRRTRASHVKYNANDSLESTDNEADDLDVAEAAVDIDDQGDPLGAVREAQTRSFASTSTQPASLEELSAHAVPTRLPTVWLGSASGWLYLHSAVAAWRRCLAAVRLQDAILSIVHCNGRLFVGLADGRVVVFFRDARTREWDVTRYALVPLTPRRAVRCLEMVAGSTIWCAAGNRIHVLDAESLELIRAFDAHPRTEARVRHVAWVGDGVWLATRPDATLRLFHAFTYEHLQTVDIEPLIERVLGPSPFASVARITALMVACDRLWLGTEAGVTLTLPFVATDHRPFVLGASASASSGGAHRSQRATPSPGAPMRVLYEDSATKRIQPGTSFVPYANAQLASISFHGHRDAVRFFVCAPTRSNAGQRRTPSICESGSDARRAPVTGQTTDTNTERKAERAATTEGWLVISGGQGYIDVRHGDPETNNESNSANVNSNIEDDASTDGDDRDLRQRILASKQERSHLIVWQVIAT